MELKKSAYCVRFSTQTPSGMTDCLKDHSSLAKNAKGKYKLSRKRNYEQV